MVLKEWSDKTLHIYFLCVQLDNLNKFDSETEDIQLLNIRIFLKGYLYYLLTISQDILSYLRLSP